MLEVDPKTGQVSVRWAKATPGDTILLGVVEDGQWADSLTNVLLSKEDWGLNFSTGATLAYVMSDYAMFEGDYVVFYAPQQFGDAHFAGFIAKYYLAEATDVAYLLMRELTGTTPFRGAKQLVVVEPWRGEAVCGISGNPVRIGFSMMPTPYIESCLIRRPYFQPNWGVLWHELGHSFTYYGSEQFLALYSGNGEGFNYSEGLATLLALNAAHRILEEPGHFGLPTIAVESMKENGVYYEEPLFRNRLAEYEAGRAPFDHMDPQIMAGIFIRLAETYGWEMYPRFFKLFLPSEEVLPLLQEAGADPQKMHTLTVAALSVAAGVDLKERFRGWDFPIVDDYYVAVKDQLERWLGP